MMKSISRELSPIVCQRSSYGTVILHVDRGPLLEWTKIEDPRERLRYQCSRELQQACDDWYLANYIRWYVLGFESSGII